MAESVIKKDPMLTSTTPTNLVGGGGSITIEKYGRQCVLSLQGTFNNISASTYTKICDMPNEYKPKIAGLYQDNYSYFTSDMKYIVHISGSSVFIRRGGTATGNIGIYTNIPYISAT